MCTHSMTVQINSVNVCTYSMTVSINFVNMSTHFMTAPINPVNVCPYSIIVPKNYSRKILRTLYTKQAEVKWKIFPRMKRQSLIVFQAEEILLLNWIHVRTHTWNSFHTYARWVFQVTKEFCISNFGRGVGAIRIQVLYIISGWPLYLRV